MHCAGRLLLFLPAFAALLSPAAGQNFYFGLKGGVLLTDNRAGLVSAVRTGVYDSRVFQHRYAVGPSAEIGLPARLRLEAGFLYRRFSRDEFIDNGPSFWTMSRVRGGRWEFPLVLKRAWGSGRVRPFLGAGGSWTHVPAVDQEYVTYHEAGPPPYAPSTFRGKGSADNTGAWIVTGGLRLQGPAGIKLTPELRFSRYTSGLLLPSRNQAEFFLGIGFSHGDSHGDSLN